MKVNVGDYIRTQRGISKILELYTITTGEKIYKIDKNGYLTLYFEYEFINESEIIGEPSKNLMDLIQVGDYVNGCKVIEIFYDYANNEKVLVSSENYHIRENKIKTIVTKGQMEGMSYHVKD